MIQTDILAFFQTQANPFWDGMATGITMFGEELIYILIIAVFFWGISKKKGMILAFTLLTSLFLNNLVKILVHSPRPFEVLDNINGKRLKTATGYSFPSGHTQGASSFYFTLVYLFRNRLFQLCCLVILFLVGISRLYLGVHWPLDVLGGWFLGISTAWLVASKIDRLWEDPSGLERLILILSGLTILFTAMMSFLEVFYFRGAVKTEDFFKGAGILLGCFSGFLIERRFTDFSASKGTLLQKILRIFIGISGIVLLQGGVKVLLSDAAFSHLLRYALMGLWMTLIFPWLGCKVRLFDSSPFVGEAKTQEE
ncbi:phosphatase PAP2 family protein [Oceanispirochaeta crateris]|uniref:Phosphatase PAP2 family protein n=1 Tax=Oceanispirochaeta crateris TaxID=2518645 RepID=A0A5C1QEX4_9SPIO|nr:phosphatase PAP2 family protein [Oceanispirochaeta crateris]QEN06613.1 phosphatase PAP2 family protein [Oceanispirochaeta crateris]